MKTLKDLNLNESAYVKTVGGEGELRQHFLDMGVIPGAKVTLVKYAPEVTDQPLHEESDAPDHLDRPYLDASNSPFDHHPGLGEDGIYHDEKNAHPVPEGTTLTFALAGNQNCGKTTLFNQLTGSNQHVGNFPGVTVDRKSGAIKGYPETLITDLPGIYSMSPYSAEEIVSRQFILNEKPTGIINIVDATNIERNLYLTMQLIELDKPMVVALNMMDEVQGNGGSIKINKLEAMLGVPVVPISARYDFCDENDHGGAVHRALHAIMHLIQDHADEAQIPIRFAASKLIEGDEVVLNALNLDNDEKKAIEAIIAQMEKERHLDRAAAIADMRFAFIEKCVAATVIKPRESKEHERSRRIDAILTGKYTAIPAFIIIMAIIFYLTFNLVGAYFQDLIATGIDHLTNIVALAMKAGGVNEVLQSLVINGIFTGVGSVLSFLPLIVLLFFFLSLLEDTGYMARIAFVMDKLLRKIGLSGRSVVPMLMGFGCSVPAVMSSRTLPSDRDRKMTIMLVPFMSCTAKLPIYAFFTAAFFPGHGAIVMVLLYFLGIVVGILTALLSKNTFFKGEAVPFVMELPNYRLPSARNVLQLLWEKSKDFIQRAFTIIFVASIVIWFLQNFGLHLQLVKNPDDSILAYCASFIAPIFKPLGFGDWRITSALITGFMAKESVVSTLTVLFGSTAHIMSTLTTLSAASLLVFCLLYTPCVAAIASIKRELGGRWAGFIVIFQCVIAYLCAFIVHTIGLLF